MTPAGDTSRSGSNGLAVTKVCSRDQTRTHRHHLVLRNAGPATIWHLQSSTRLGRTRLCIWAPTDRGGIHPQSKVCSHCCLLPHLKPFVHSAGFAVLSERVACYRYPASDGMAQFETGSKPPNCQTLSHRPSTLDALTRRGQRTVLQPGVTFRQRSPGLFQHGIGLRIPCMTS